MCDETMANFFRIETKIRDYFEKFIGRWVAASINWIWRRIGVINWLSVSVFPISFCVYNLFVSLCLRFVDLIHLCRIRRVLNFIIACANNKRHSSAESKCELAFATTVIYILFDFFFLLSHAHYLMPLFNAQSVSLSLSERKSRHWIGVSF